MTSSREARSTPYWERPFYDLPGSANIASKHYCSWVNGFFGRFSLEGLARSQEPIALRDIYVPLALSESLVDEQTTEEKLTKVSQDILDCLAKHPVLFLSGPPGSGKTTLLRYLVSSLASHKTNEINRALPDFLPIPLILRDYTIDNFHSLNEMIDHWMQQVRENAGASFHPEHLQPYLDQGRYVLFLDGFDEVGTEERRIKVNQWLWNDRRNRAHTNKTPGLTIITSRPSGWSEFVVQEEAFAIGGSWKDPDVGSGITPLRRVVPLLEASDTVGFRAVMKSDESLEGKQKTSQRSPLFGKVFHVVPFSLDKIEMFCEKWFQLPTYMNKQQKTQAKELFQAIQDSRRTDLLQLAKRPSFLTLMAFVHATINKLPDSRAELFANLIEAYLHILEEWRKLIDKTHQTGFPPWPRSDKSIILSQLGYIAQIGGSAKQEGERLFRWSRADVEEKVKQIIAARSSSFQVATPDHACLLVTYFLGRTGLLTEPEEGQIEFGHLSFQEYLAAVHLHAQASGATDKASFVQHNLWKRLEEVGWEEVATFFMAIDALQTHKRGHALLLEKLDLHSHKQCLWLARLLGGREITFGEKERRYWIAAVVAGGIVGGMKAVGYELRREPDNHPHFWTWFEMMSEDWQGKAPPLKRLAESLASSDNASQGKSNTQLDALGNPVANVSPEVTAREFCKTFCQKTSSTQDAENQFIWLCLIASELGSDQMPSSPPWDKIVPQSDVLFQIKENNLWISPVYWALNTLVDRQQFSLASTLMRRSHLAVVLCFTEADIPAWAVTSASEWTSSAQTVLRALSITLTSIPRLDDPSALARARARDRDRARALDLDLDLALALALARDRARDRARARDLARALALARDRALDLDLDKSSRMELANLLFKFASAAEGYLLAENPHAPITRDDLQWASDVLSNEDWIQEDDPALQKRMVKEFLECQQLGLLPPPEILQEALKDEAWLEKKMTPRQVLEQTAADINAWVAAKREPHPDGF